MFYGLQNYRKTYSLSEIGSKLNETKQYVFYIKERALNKLKKNMLPQAA